jgi:hypothetical protein
MKRSWLINALIASSVASAVLLLFSALNDAGNLSFHSYLVPIAFTGTLWNIVGLLPSPASLVGLIPHVASDSILTPHYRPVAFFSVLVITALLCLLEAHGLRQRQKWALLAMGLFLLVDLLVQGSSLVGAVRSDWPAFRGVSGLSGGLLGFFLFTKRMFLKLFIDAGCAALLLSDGYGSFSLSSATAPAANLPQSLSSVPAAMPSEESRNPWPAVAKQVELTPLLRSNRTVFLSACTCIAALSLMIVSKSLAPPPSAGQYDIFARLLPGFLYALLHYALVAWHTRREPERFALGLATACSLTVSASGFASGPVLFLAMFQHPSGIDAPGSSSLMPLAFLTLVFVLANFVLLFASLRTSWLARSEAARSPISWALGFVFPFAVLIVVRGIILQ